MNTQIHAYRDLPAISAKLRSAFPEQSTAEQLQTMPSNTHGTADPAGGADVSRSTLNPRRAISSPRNHGEEIWNLMQMRDELVRLDPKGAL